MKKAGKKIVVFAGNECRKDLEEYYHALAYKTGELLSQAGFVVVTGGGQGLMNEVCRGAIETGGETIGICLELKTRQNSSFLTTRESYHHLRPRQDRLISLADAFIALPGGIGTLYEIFAVLALKRKFELERKIPLIIIDDYFHELKILFDKIIELGFANTDIKSLYKIVKTPQQGVDKLKKVLL